MKKLFLILAGAISVVVFGGATFLSQTFVWDYYKIQLTVPDDFKVAKNSDEEFAMNGEGMHLMMEIFEQNINIDELDEAVKSGAKAMKLEAIDDQHEVDTNGLQGYYVEGMFKGRRVMFAGMMDPNSSTNFFISISFEDKDKTAEADALRILGSIKRLK